MITPLCFTRKLPICGKPWIVCIFLVGVFHSEIFAQDYRTQTAQAPTLLPSAQMLAGQNNSPSASPSIIPLPPLKSDTENRVQLQSNAEYVTLVTRDAPLATVLSMISQQQGLNIVTGEDVRQRVNVTLNNVKLNDALDAILDIHGLTWVRHNNIITISSIQTERKTSPSVQGRTVRVFTLNYVLASDVDVVIKGLMSPLGQSFFSQTNSKEQRQSHEQLIVEDMPPYLERIAEYIAQVDTMPRQVVVEANILQVALKDNNRHGVNVSQLARVSNSNIRLETLGLASGTAPVSAMRISGTDLTSLIDLLKSTSDTKTLASPKVAVVNGQKARISVGGKLGYLLTTATNTSTLQSVEFLPFGVVLEVTPIISDDGQILMNVAPQVSTARINPITKLPDSESTEVTTTALLANGQAIVIGGLIKETNNDGQNKVPFLGDLWLVGRLFQSRDRLKERSEVIITLLPRIARPDETCAFASDEDHLQATTPLVDKNLTPVDRTDWEGSLADASKRSSLRNWFRKKKSIAVPPAATAPLAPLQSPVHVEPAPSYNTPMSVHPNMADPARGYMTSAQP